MNDRDIYRGKQIDGVRPHFVTGHYISAPRPMIVATKTRIGGGWDAEDVDPDTVGRCTGLRDQNGTLIFEGDIVKLCDTNPILFIVSIEMKKYGWACVFRYADDGKIDTGAILHRCEVIGNIHDNPELLKKKVTP